MLATTANYKAAIDAPSRLMQGVAIVDFVEPWEYPFATVVASTTANGYDPNNACDGRFRPNTTLHSGVGLPTPLRFQKKGWQGVVSSNGTGILSSAEILTATYAKEVEVTNFWVVGTLAAYPVDFSISVLENGTWVTIANVVGNNNWLWCLHLDIPKSITAVRLTITKVYPAGSPAAIIEFGAVTTVVFQDDDIVELNVLEETKAEELGPISAVTSNFCALSLRNDEKIFTIANEQSPFYKLLRPQIRFRPYLGVEVQDNLFEVMPMGVFFTTEWTGRTQTLETHLEGYDILYDIGNRDMIEILPKRDTTIKQLFDTLFDELGLDSTLFSVDITLDQIPIEWGYFDQSKVKDALQDLSVAGDATTNVSRLGIIQVKKNNYTAAPVKQWHDDNQIIDLDNPQRFTDTYSEVSVKLYTPAKTKNVQLGSLEDVEVPGNDDQVFSSEFNHVPVVKVQYVKVSADEDVNITDLFYGGKYYTLNIDNLDSSSAEASVEVVGTTLNMSTEDIKVSDPDANKSFKKTIFIDNYLIQDETFATNYATALLQFVKDPLSNFSIEARGDMSLELMDIISVTDVGNNISADIIITRQEFKYDGSLSVTIEGRKV